MLQNYRKKIKKVRNYIDDEGFECCSEHTDYEEVEVEVEKAPKPMSKLTAKRPVYKAPASGQASISNFFNRG